VVLAREGRAVGVQVHQRRWAGNVGRNVGHAEGGEREGGVGGGWGGGGQRSVLE
jgi:hypothetical protein